MEVPQGSLVFQCFDIWRKKRATNCSKWPLAIGLLGWWGGVSGRMLASASIPVILRMEGPTQHTQSGVQHGETVEVPLCGAGKMAQWVKGVAI